MHGATCGCSEKDINGQEVYIKIAYGMPNSHAICISFHIAEFPMNYPYKKGGRL